VAEDWIQLPPDGTGKKVRAIKRPDNRYEEVMIPYSKDGEIDLRQLYNQLTSILSELKQKLETTQLNIDTEKDLQVDVKSTANPPNLDVGLSTRASETTLSSIDGKVATENTLASELTRLAKLRGYDPVGLVWQNIYTDGENRLKTQLDAVPNPSNLDVALSTRASDSNLTRTDVESAVGVFSKRVDIRYDNVGLAKEDRQIVLDLDGHGQVDVLSTANPPNLNVQLSTRATEATLSSIDGKVATETSLVSSLPRKITDIEKVADVVKYVAPTALSAGGTVTIWTPATGKKARPKLISVSVDARTRIELRWGTTPFESHFLPVDGNIIFNLIGANDEGAVDESLTLLSSEAVTVTVTARGDEV